MVKVVSLCSGSKGNSTYIECNGIKFLFDAGTTCKYLTETLRKINVEITDIDYVFLTHAHSDHVSALPQIIKNTNAKLVVPEKLFSSIKSKDKLTYYSFFEDEYNIDDICVKALKSSHDSPDSRNYTIKYKDKKISIITDTGYIKQKYFKEYSNSNIILIESNHDIKKLQNGRYPEYLKKRILSDEGHLSNNQTGFYLTKIIGKNTDKVLLIHLSEENNDPIIALDTISEVLNQSSISFSNLECAKQYEINEVANYD